MSVYTTAECVGCGKQKQVHPITVEVIAHAVFGSTGWKTCAGSGAQPVPGTGKQRSLLAAEEPEEAAQGTERTLADYKASLASAPGSGHYSAFPGGVEPIMLTRHMDFCRGNAAKYILRAGSKGGDEGELLDLQKAQQYLTWAIENLKEKQAND